MRLFGKLSTNTKLCLSILSLVVVLLIVIVPYFIKDKSTTKLPPSGVVMESALDSAKDLLKELKSSNYTKNFPEFSSRVSTNIIRDKFDLSTYYNLSIRPTLDEGSHLFEVHDLTLLGYLDENTYVFGYNWGKSTSSDILVVRYITTTNLNFNIGDNNSIVSFYGVNCSRVKIGSTFVNFIYA